MIFYEWTQTNLWRKLCSLNIILIHLHKVWKQSFGFGELKIFKILFKTCSSYYNVAGEEVS